MCLPTDTAVKDNFLFFFFFFFLKEQGKLGISYRLTVPASESQEFKSNLSYRVRTCLKRTRKKEKP